jgi:hypothetical protein
MLSATSAWLCSCLFSVLLLVRCTERRQQRWMSLRSSSAGGIGLMCLGLLAAPGMTGSVLSFEVIADGGGDDMDVVILGVGPESQHRGQRSDADAVLGPVVLAEILVPIGEFQ